MVKISLGAKPQGAQTPSAPSPAPTPAPEQERKLVTLKIRTGPLPNLADPSSAGGNSTDATPISAKAAGKKRAADDDTLIPAAKRMASAPIRKPSIKLINRSQAPEHAAPRPKIALAASRKASMPQVIGIRSKGRAPARLPGLGYDSEDSNTEKDPAIQQACVLRMVPGDDANYLRKAIAEDRIGPHFSKGDAEVSIKFVEKGYRRAVIKIRGRLYAAVLVDLPTITETMKSFDKKVWHKNADIDQMLLVVGRIQNEDEAKTIPLPREIPRGTYQYPHGLTPPMHDVRRRRFRKHLNHHTIANTEEEVTRMLNEDKAYTDVGGESNFEIMTQEQHDRRMNPDVYNHASDEEDDQDDEEDADGEAVETTEMGREPEYDDDWEEQAEEDEVDHEAALLEGMHAEFSTSAPVPVAPAEDSDLLKAMRAEFGSSVMPKAPITTAPVTAEPASILPTAPVVEQQQALSLPVTVETPQAIADSEAPTPMGTSGAGSTPADEATSDEEYDSDEYESESEEEPDEEALARAAERAQQMEEVADLEKEIVLARNKLNVMTNQLLRKRQAATLAGLEEDLKVKRKVFGLEEEEEA